MKRPKTIAQYCIMKWLEANFYLESLEITFTSGDVADIKDSNGETAKVIYDDGNIYLA